MHWQQRKMLVHCVPRRKKMKSMQRGIMKEMQTTYERVHTCNKINKLENRQWMCDREFERKMIWHKDCKQYFVAERFFVCLFLYYFVFVCVFFSLFIVLSLFNALFISFVPSVIQIVSFSVSHNFIVYEWNYLFLSLSLIVQTRFGRMIRYSIFIIQISSFSLCLKKRKCRIMRSSISIIILLCNLSVFIELHRIMISLYRSLWQCRSLFLSLYLCLLC
jgi:hypothetical protein